MSLTLRLYARAGFEACRALPALGPSSRFASPHGHSFTAQVRSRKTASNGAVEALQAELQTAVKAWNYQDLGAQSDESLAMGLQAQLPEAESISLRSAPGHGVLCRGGQSPLYWRRYRFESAHRLPNVPPGHKCGRMHGHGFMAQLLLPGQDMHCYERLDLAWAPLQQALHHRCLNHIAGLENPTSENLAAWLWQQLHSSLPELVAVRVYETASCGAQYDGQLYRIWKDVPFDSATCDARGLHGHTYTLRLQLQAPLDAVLGWTEDFGEVKAQFDPIFRRLDHHPLHEIEGLPESHPAAVANWVRQNAAEQLPALERVDLSQSPGCGALLHWGAAELDPL